MVNRTRLGILGLAALSSAALHACATNPDTENRSTGKSAQASSGPQLHVTARAVRLFGDRATEMLAPGSDTLNALVEVHDARDLQRYGLVEVAPGIGSFRGGPKQLLALAEDQRTKSLELSPRLHLLNDRTGVTVGSQIAQAAGVTGRGTLIGVADTGIDLYHPDFRDAAGKTRVKWLLDFSQVPRRVHAAAEAEVQVTSGGRELGAVWSAAEIDAELAANSDELPRDPDGHGTHVSGIAAGNGGLGALAGLPAGERGPFVGVAPEAGLIVVRLPTFEGGGIEVDNLVRAVKFIFGRGDLEKLPTVVNMSLGTDFGAHDGTTLWERAITSYVGPDKPGHILVAAAGNSGSVGDTPIHESVYVAPNSRMSVPIVVPNAATNGRVQVWVNMRPGAQVNVGLDGPSGEWIAPIGANSQRGYAPPGGNAGVIVGQVEGTPIPQGSQSAVVLWSGAVAAGTYKVTLEGSGNVDLYLEGGGELGAGRSAPRFRAGVREGTVNLPGVNPAIITVGCTVGRSRWKSINGLQLGPVQPNLDLGGGLPIGGASATVPDEVCFFSSAGPNSAGVAKPDIAAPGGGIVSSMSSVASPGRPLGIFTTDNCPKLADGQNDNRCLQIDERHAVTSGTSMSSPAVAGVAALMLQRDPTLTQEQMRAVLQGGAHRFRGAARFADQSGPGEVDAVGSLLALERLKQPSPQAPVLASSWLAPSSEYVQADGAMPLTVLALLRGVDGSAADVADLARVRVVAKVVGSDVLAQASALTRRGAGAYAFTLRAPAASGGGTLEIQLFDGPVAIAPARRVRIAADGWRSLYGSRGVGGCSLANVISAPRVAWSTATFGLALVAYAFRRRAKRVANRNS